MTDAPTTPPPMTPAGTHTHSITMRYADFDRLGMPTVVDIARQKAGFTA